ncbi:flagellar protein FliS [Andreprevotia lacus DSM 23236]|jgi:flagellar protein FliS|uniref:Flagellar secretion chaperone FliS n=1 Tax=Andreprevotia lacus DSM 23236 TaxID=1121001 RepID=A0A1W1XIX2_9NEIS|nr:flagellar export chaperone FliS [Andreprevotia lacus]SMC23458.1 flagellar protein FliS [Andreprevotia lacus DSM 23236]
MTAAVKKALDAYGKQSLETAVETASPGRLIVMLYDGAIKAAQLGKFHMQNGDIPAKGAAITRAIAILDEGLRLALDREKGGELAENLDALYIYMLGQLFEANLSNRPELLDEVVTLLTQLREAWESITTGVATQPEVAEMPADRGQNSALSYGRA